MGDTAQGAAGGRGLHADQQPGPGGGRALHLGVQGGQQHQELLRPSHPVRKPAALPDQDGGGREAAVLLKAGRGQEQ